jgi:UDP-N-acetylmuramyl tripeptide synthase
MLLIKNPTGFNQVIQTFLRESASPIMIGINDNFADGRDVSWLWDVAFEEIGTDKDLQLVSSGVRANDLALRLKYADRESEVIPDLVKAFERIVALGTMGETVYLAVTYTAMLSLRRRIGSRVGLTKFWDQQI